MIRTLGAAQVDCSFWGRIAENLNPWVSNAQLAADEYECAVYGSIPAPAAPAPNAPQTAGQMTQPGAWTPADATNSGSDWYDATSAKIQDAMNSGNYNPSADAAATRFDKYKWPLILGGTAVALFAAVKLR